MTGEIIQRPDRDPTYPLPTYVLGGSNNGARRRPSDAQSLTLHKAVQWRDGRPDSLPGNELYRPFRHALGGIPCCVWIPAEWTDAQAEEVILEMAGRMWAHFVDPDKKGHQ